MADFYSFNVLLGVVLLFPLMCTYIFFSIWRRSHTLIAAPKFEGGLPVRAAQDGPTARLAGIMLTVQSSGNPRLELIPPISVPSMKDGPNELLGVSVALLSEAIYNAGSGKALEDLHTELHQSRRFLQRCKQGDS